MEDTFTPNHTQKHIEPVGLESFRFSASYFSCRAIHSCKGGFKPRAVLGRQLQAVVRALPWPPAHRAAPSRTAQQQRAHLRPPSDVLNSICQPLYFSIIGTFCFCITECILINSEPKLGVKTSRWAGPPPCHPSLWVALAARLGGQSCARFPTFRKTPRSGIRTLPRCLWWPG